MRKLNQPSTHSGPNPLNRVHRDAHGITRARRGTDEPYHSIEVLAALAIRHKRIKPAIERYINPIASKWGNRRAAEEFELLDKEFLRMGSHTLPLESESLDRIARDLSAFCKTSISRYGYTKKAIRHCNFQCSFNGVPPLKVNSSGLIPSLNRYADEKWWKRILRKTQNRKLESFYRYIGFVQRRRQAYVSDWNLSNRQSQLAIHQRFFDQFDLVNELGEVHALEDAVQSSVANPKNRRCELMARMSGFEKVAAQLGHACLFGTVTTPSRFHRTNASGKPNPNFDGSSPREAQQWLRLVWSRVRAALARRNIQVYGFRIAEPHHDGTPHWHLLLFLSPNKLNETKELILRYWLADGGNELGAQDHRVRFIDIDPTKGSATGYVAKYVSKSIDGKHIDSDNLGIEGKNAAERIVASCTTWGIRQFQQIGGPPVSIWRELRRAALKITDPVIHALRQAADLGHWDEFVLRFGGPFLLRKDFPVRLLQIDLDPANTEYGDTGLKKVIGVQSAGMEPVLTRLHTWTLIPRGRPAQLAMAS